MNKTFEYTWDDEENEREIVFEINCREIEGSPAITFNQSEQPICPPERGHYELDSIR